MPQLSESSGWETKSGDHTHREGWIGELYCFLPGQHFQESKTPKEKKTEPEFTKKNVLKGRKIFFLLVLVILKLETGG